MRHKGHINKMTNNQKSNFPKDLARYLDLMTQNHFIQNKEHQILWREANSSAGISTGKPLIKNWRQPQVKNRKSPSNHQNFGTIMIIIQQINHCKTCFNAMKTN